MKNIFMVSGDYMEEEYHSAQPLSTVWVLKCKSVCERGFSPNLDQFPVGYIIKK